MDPSDSNDNQDSRDGEISLENMLTQVELEYTFDTVNWDKADERDIVGEDEILTSAGDEYIGDFTKVDATNFQALVTFLNISTNHNKAYIAEDGVYVSEATLLEPTIDMDDIASASLVVLRDFSQDGIIEELRPIGDKKPPSDLLYERLQLSDDVAEFEIIQDSGECTVRIVPQNTGITESELLRECRNIRGVKYSKPDEILFVDEISKDSENTKPFEKADPISTTVVPEFAPFLSDPGKEAVTKIIETVDNLGDFHQSIENNHLKFYVENKRRALGYLTSVESENGGKVIVRMRGAKCGTLIDRGGVVFYDVFGKSKEEATLDDILEQVHDEAKAYFSDVPLLDRYKEYTISEPTEDSKRKGDVSTSPSSDFQEMLSKNNSTDGTRSKRTTQNKTKDIPNLEQQLADLAEQATKPFGDIPSEKIEELATEYNLNPSAFAARIYDSAQMAKEKGENKYEFTDNQLWQSIGKNYITPEGDPKVTDSEEDR